MESTKEKKESGIANYFKGAYEEFKKITWPTKEETWKKSWIVIWFSVGFALFLGTLDFFFNRLLQVIV